MAQSKDVEMQLRASMMGKENFPSAANPGVLSLLMRTLITAVVNRIEN